VELFNASDDPIELNGLVLTDDDLDSYQISESIVVQPGEYAVVCADESPVWNGMVPCDGEFLWDWRGGGFAMANTGDEVVLTLPDGTEVDWVVYDEGWVEPGVAVGLDPDHLDTFDNNHSSNWCLQSTVGSSGGEPGTPGTQNDPC
jgi:hypothetical protein